MFVSERSRTELCLAGTSNILIPPTRELPENYKHVNLFKTKKCVMIISQ